MKNLIILLVMACLPFTVQAQQNQKMRRSPYIFAYKDFQEAKVRQPFGKVATAQANIYLKDASLMYMENGKVMRAYVKNILGVDFGDSVRYMKVDSAMARVVAQKGYNYLLCKTTVNMARYREEESGGTGLDFFDMPDSGLFMELNQDRRDEDMGIPLQDTYYFSIKGLIIPANESAFKKFVRKEEMQAFKVLKENRFWSWRDPESLKMLMDFLPD